MNIGIDTGKVYMTKSFPLGKDDNIATINAKANTLFSSMIPQLLKKIKNKKASALNQNERNTKYWHQRSDKDGEIDWKTMTAKNVFNFIRALTKPYKGAYTFLKSEKIRIYSCQITKKKFYVTPGRVLKKKNNMLVIICADHGLYVNDYKLI